MSLDQITLECSGAPLGLSLRLPAGYLGSVVIPTSRELWTEKREWVEDRGMTVQTQILPTHFRQGREEHGHVIPQIPSLANPGSTARLRLQKVSSQPLLLSGDWAWADYQEGNVAGGAQSVAISLETNLALESPLPLLSHHLPTQQPLPSINSGDGGGLSSCCNLPSSKVMFPGREIITAWNVPQHEIRKHMKSVKWNSEL